MTARREYNPPRQTAPRRRHVIASPCEAIHLFSGNTVDHKSTKRKTIPQPVRAALHLREGDEIAYTIEPGRVILTRAQPETPAEDPFKTFSEWDSPADTQAYANL
jgi:antitoxin PrlF